MGDPEAYESVIAAYLRDCERRGLRPATVRYYAMALREIGAAAGIERIDELTVRRVRGFQDARDDLAPGTIRGFLRAAKTLGRWAYDEERVDADPLARLRLPRVDRTVVSVPTDAELVELLRAAAVPLRFVMALLVGTGLRISDVAALTLGSLRPGELVLASMKNRAGRLVPLDPVLEVFLAAHVSDVRPRGGQALFLSRVGRPLGADAIRHAPTDARARAGIEIPIGPHVLRHWHARDLASHATADRILAARMGWASQELIGRYAPVAHAEVQRDTHRYAPLPRLRDDGLFAGLFPARLIEPGAVVQRSKNDTGRTRFASGWGRDARHS